MKRKELFRSIPSIDEIVKKEWVKEYIDMTSRDFVINLFNSLFEFLRDQIRAGKVDYIDEKLIRDNFDVFFHQVYQPSLKSVINATGVIIHTNLGRAPLPTDMILHIMDVACSYSNLEYDLEKGERGLRYVHVSELLKILTDCEDAMVVNNNAGAVLLVLSALCKGKKVIVSRGELIEIGGSFRIPEVMEQSGCILVEVGTTNRTHIYDYERAIDDETGALMKVHKSNYSIVGFTKEVSVEELVELGRKYNLPVIVDLGSGAFVDVSKFGIKPPEPVVKDVLKKGADIVTISGDKLLGGPQAGIIMGKAELVEKIRKHPLNRALRIDKLTLAALEYTLRQYFFGRLEKIPVINMIATPYEHLLKRVKNVKKKLKRKIGEYATLDIIDGASKIGGGSLPLAELRSPLLSVKPKNMSAQELERKLRYCDPPIIAIIRDDAVLFDFRTIFEHQEPTLTEALEVVLKPWE